MPDPNALSGFAALSEPAPSGLETSGLEDPCVCAFAGDTGDCLFIRIDADSSPAQVSTGNLPDAASGTALGKTDKGILASL